MNYLDGTHFVAAYPQLSFKDECLVAPMARDHGVPETASVRWALDKYRTRGYDIRLSRYDLSYTQQKVTAIVTVRTFEDDYAFRLYFGGNREDADIPLSLLWFVEWQLGGRLGALEYEAVGWTKDRFSHEIEHDYYSDMVVVM